MRRFATDKHEAVVSIPDVVRVAVVSVEPQPIVVVFDVEHVEVAVRVRSVQNVVHATAPRILLRLYRIRHHNALTLCTK